MMRVWNLCKVLANEHRKTLLSEIYLSRDGGCNVGFLVDVMDRRLEAPAVTQYLRQLEQIGLLRRERRGRYVNYYDDMREAVGEVREISRMIRSRIREYGRYDDKGMFRVLMNAFRARVCHYLMAGGDGGKGSVCEKFQHIPKYLGRDLRPAVEVGLLSEQIASYDLIIPQDPIVRRVIELAA